MFFAACPLQFIDEDGAPAGLQMAVLGLIFVGIALGVGQHLGHGQRHRREWLSGRPTAWSASSAFGGTVMIGLGLRLALTGRKD